MLALLRAQGKLFGLALSFYTRLPCPGCLDYQDLPRAGLYLPVIGWLVGALCALSFYLADLLWSQSTAVVLALGTGILLTGALHEDGFADVCDGFGGGYDKQRILAIMQDSHIGVYGALGLLCLLCLKWSVLTSTDAAQVPALLLAGHSISRLLPLLLMRQYTYARSSDSKAAQAMLRPSRGQLGLAGAAALLPLWLLPAASSMAILPLWLVKVSAGRYFYRHLGGYTGDCLGASQQIGEVVFYLSVQAIWTFM